MLPTPLHGGELLPRFVGTDAALIRYRVLGARLIFVAVRAEELDILRRVGLLLRPSPEERDALRNDMVPLPLRTPSTALLTIPGRRVPTSHF